MKSIKSGQFDSIILPAELSPESIMEFNELLQTAINSGIPEIIIDCSRIENASSSHIGALWKAYDACNSVDVKLTLSEITTNLARVLIILDLGELFGIRDRESDSDSTGPIAEYSKAKSRVHSELILVSKEQIKNSLESFLKFLRKYDVPEITEFELRTVFYEVMTNILDHSGLGDYDNVKFSATLAANSIELVFEDLGFEFDPTTYKGPVDLADLVTSAKDRRFKGFGLLMIRKFVDSIKYERKEDMINHLEIEKHWS